MYLSTNKISTGKPGRFEDFIKNFRDSQVKTASVKVAAEQEEADSSGQLDVEPLHQEGESTTMPKAGPSAKKDDGAKAAAADTDPEKEGEDSGQPKAEGSEKFTNNVKFDPNDSTDEEKGIDAGTKAETKEAGCDGHGGNGKGNGPGKGKGDGKGDGTGTCNCGKEDCKECMASKAEAVKEAGSVPDSFKEHQFKKKDDKGEETEDTDVEAKEEDKEEKEAAAATQFVKWANLDSKNKSFLTTYWRQLFGDDYVNAMVADK